MTQLEYVGKDAEKGVITTDELEPTITHNVQTGELRKSLKSRHMQMIAVGQFESATSCAFPANPS